MGYVVEAANGKSYEYPSDYPNLDSAIARAIQDSKFNEWEIFYFSAGILFLVPMLAAFHLEYKRLKGIRNLKSLNELRQTGVLADTGNSDQEIAVKVVAEFILVIILWFIATILLNVFIL